MKTMRLKYWCLLVLSVLLAGACSDGELEGDLYPVSPGEDGNGIPEESNPDIRLKSIDFVFVNAGAFMMGATKEQMPEAFTDEIPGRRVALSKNYYIGKYEITQEQWEKVMGSNPSVNRLGGKYPVEGISWNMTQQFISKLNASSRVKFRLPTEAEWEFAARGGRESSGNLYSGGNSLNNCGWYIENSGEKTHIVGSKTANELGIYDMSGNVQEWCYDYYGDYNNAGLLDPHGPEYGQDKVLRGGYWESESTDCRISRRAYASATNRIAGAGLRLIAEYDASKAFLEVSSEMADSVTLITARGYSSYSELYVEASQQWTVSTDESWITYKIDKDTLLITIAKNSLKEKRVGYLTIKSGNLSHKVTIEQEPYIGDYLKISTEEIDSVKVLTLPGLENELDLIVLSGNEWSVSGASEWIDYSVDGKKNKIHLTVSKNNIESDRIGYITVISGNLSQRITVKQAIYEPLAIMTDTVVFEAKAGSKSIQIYKDENIGTCTCKSAVSWCVPTITGSSLIIEVKENTEKEPRETEVVVKCGSYTKTITVKQKEREPEISFGDDLLVDEEGTKYIDFTWEALEKELSVTAKQEWTCTSGDSWCKVQKMSDTKLKISVTANSTGKLRSTKLVFKVAGETIEVSIFQRERIYNFTFVPTELIVDCKGTTGTYISLNTDAPSWTCSVDSYYWWCQAVKEGNRIKISVEEYNDEEDRYAYVTVKSGTTQAASVRVKQKGKVVTLSLEPSKLEFKADEITTKKVNVNTNTYWSIEQTTMPSWLTVKKAQSTDELEVTVTRPNTSIVDLEKIITVVAGKNTKRELVITQLGEAKKLELSTESIYFKKNQSGNDLSQTVEITTNMNDWSVSIPASAPWCTYEKINPTSFRINVQENLIGAGRITEVTVTAGNLVKKISVHQEAKEIEISLSPEVVNFLANQNESELKQDIMVTTNVSEWTVSVPVSDTWCNFEIIDQTSFRITASVNMTGVKRETDVIVKAGFKIKKIHVSQEPKEIDLNVSPENLIMENTSATESFVVTSNLDDWSISLKSTGQLTGKWASLSFAGNRINLTSEQNLLGFVRYDTIIVQAGWKKVKIPIEQKAGDVKIEMVKVNGGRFSMGSERNENEKPIHIVRVSDYQIGKYEVTWQLYDAVMYNRYTPYGFSPVVNITYAKILTFINKLNSMTGKHYRLPTEAEWEYAARGGENASPYDYSGSNILSQVGNYKEGSNYAVKNVGRYSSNALGIYDMSGNVFEACRDYYGDYSAAEVKDPIGPTSGTKYVMRGGGYNSEAKACTVSYRAAWPGSAADNVGFRLVLSE